MSDSPPGGIVVFSGGSAANSLVDVFNEVAEKKGAPLSYVIPVSDNGGSSSEIIRVIGGPGIGDVRSKWGFLLVLVLFCGGLEGRRWGGLSVSGEIFSTLKRETELEFERARQVI